MLLDHGYWPTPSSSKKCRVPFLTIWVKKEADYKSPWGAMTKMLWDFLELWARAAGGIVRLFFGLDRPEMSVTYHTYASEQAFDQAYAYTGRPHWDWCDDTGQFSFDTDEAGRAWIGSWFPDSPEDYKVYYLAWDESRSGYWASCQETYTYNLENGVNCSVPEAIALSEMFLEYEPFAFEKAQQRTHRLSEKKEQVRQNVISFNLQRRA